tara:strand:- start:1721 stop:1849 length:129 start_codon:yes stop_codon:yes gene_type:complete
MKVLLILLLFVGASLFNDHPHKNFDSNLGSNNQTLETLKNDF